MNNEEFIELFDKQTAACRDLLAAKGKEYSKDDDRLHNFKVAAVLQNETPREALGGMFAKHIVSIFDLINQEELADAAIWDEKLGDALNYLFLLKAVVVEERGVTPKRINLAPGFY